MLRAVLGSDRPAAGSAAPESWPEKTVAPTHTAPWPRPWLHGCALRHPLLHQPWLNTPKTRENQALQGAKWAGPDRRAVTLACVCGDRHLQRAPPDTCPLTLPPPMGLSDCRGSVGGTGPCCAGISGVAVGVGTDGRSVQESAGLLTQRPSAPSEACLALPARYLPGTPSTCVEHMWSPNSTGSDTEGLGLAMPRSWWPHSSPQATVATAVLGTAATYALLPCSGGRPEDAEHCVPSLATLCSNSSTG